MNKELLKLAIEKKNIPRCKPDKKNFIPHYMVGKFHEFLVPDSNYYHSNLNSAFVFDLEYSSDELIKLSRIFSLRDGVLNTLRYFMLNPEYSEGKPALIFDSKLSCLVPNSYRENTLLRTPYSIGKCDNKNELIILISATPQSILLSFLELEIEKIKSKISPSTKISVFLSPVKLRGEGHVHFDHGHGYKVFEVLLKKFSSFEITVINWSEYLVKDFSHSSFYFLNPISFYFTDSFLFHDLSQKGASNLFISEQVPNESYKYELSLNHGFYLHQNFDEYKSFDAEKIKNKVLLSDITNRPLNVSLSTLKFSTDEFRDWAFLVACNLYLKS